MCISGWQHKCQEWTFGNICLCCLTLSNSFCLLASFALFSLPTNIFNLYLLHKYLFFPQILKFYLWAIEENRLALIQNDVFTALHSAPPFFNFLKLVWKGISIRITYVRTPQFFTWKWITSRGWHRYVCDTSSHDLVNYVEDGIPTYIKDTSGVVYFKSHYRVATVCALYSPRSRNFTISVVLLRYAVLARSQHLSVQGKNGRCTSKVEMGTYREIK